MHKVIVKPSGHAFDVAEGESVLTAAMRQDLVLPYGCRNGACGSCKGKILEGRVDYGVYQKKALTDEEKTQGKALFCQAKPLTDLFSGKMKERDILRLEGPLGTFFLREDSAKPIVFVASGTGFAPIKSIIEHALRKGVTRPMVLYWGGRRPKDLYMNELAQKWAAEQPGFRYIPVISEALPEDHWSGRTGFVHRAVLEDFPDLSGHQVYACGVPVMVDAAQRDFTAQCRLPEDEFLADSFTTAADLAAG